MQKDRLNSVSKNDYDEFEHDRDIVKEYLQKNGNKIDDALVEKFYCNSSQAIATFRCENEEEFEVISAFFHNGIAGVDCSKMDFSGLSKENYKRLGFSTSTVFPKNVEKDFLKILDENKESILRLKNDKINDIKTHIAIIDQEVDLEKLDSKEFDNIQVENTGNICKYNADHYQHGVSTLSLLASNSCGIVKNANVHFFKSSSHKDAKRNIDSFRKIINYNMDPNNKEKISVCSISSSLEPNYHDEIKKILRENGCELVTQNDFVKYFAQSFDGDAIFDGDKSELENISEKYKDTLKKYNIADKVKIPSQRTYCDYTRDENGEFKKGKFKYQPNFSISWSIPQIAGMLANMRKIDNTLTYEDFANIAKETSIGEKHDINPHAIEKSVLERQIEKLKHKANYDKLTESKKQAVDNSIIEVYGKNEDDVEHVKNKEKDIEEKYIK